MRHTTRFGLTCALLLGVSVSAHAATYTTTPTTSPAVGPTITTPSTGYVVTDNSTAALLAFSAVSPGESGSGAGYGTISNLSIQIALGAGETLGATTLAFATGSFDDGLLIKVNGITIVDFDYSNYTTTAFGTKFGNGVAPWQPWTNEGNPVLSIDFQAGTVELLVDTAGGGRENALDDMTGSPTPNPIPSLDFMTGVTFSSAYKNYAGPGSIGEQSLDFSAAISTASAVPVLGPSASIASVLLLLLAAAYRMSGSRRDSL